MLISTSTINLQGTRNITKRSKQLIICHNNNNNNNNNNTNHTNLHCQTITPLSTPTVAKSMSFTVSMQTQITNNGENISEKGEGEMKSKVK